MRNKDLSLRRGGGTYGRKRKGDISLQRGGEVGDIYRRIYIQIESDGGREGGAGGNVAGRIHIFLLENIRISCGIIYRIYFRISYNILLSYNILYINMREALLGSISRLISFLNN